MHMDRSAVQSLRDAVQPVYCLCFYQHPAPVAVLGLQLGQYESQSLIEYKDAASCFRI